VNSGDGLGCVEFDVLTESEVAIEVNAKVAPDMLGLKVGLKGGETCEQSKADI
jgi:hypothetical protein